MKSMAAVLHDLSWARCATAPQHSRVPAFQNFFLLFNRIWAKRHGVTAITVILGNRPYSVNMNIDRILPGYVNGAFAVARWRALGWLRAIDDVRHQSGYGTEVCGIIRQIFAKEFGRHLLSTMEFGCSQAASAVHGKFSCRLKRIFEPNLGPAILTGIQGR
jgi:hypothetical protein